MFIKRCYFLKGKAMTIDSFAIDYGNYPGLNKSVANIHSYIFIIFVNYSNNGLKYQTRGTARQSGKFPEEC